MISYNYICIIGLVFVLLISVGQPGTKSNADKLNPGVASIEDKHYGLTYGDWASKWWQWTLEQPMEKNPLTDATGERCANGQGGPVWYLGGTWSGGLEKIKRDCTIPSNVAIFFPIYNGECNSAEYPQYRTNTELRDCVIEGNKEQSTKMQAWVDGKELQNLKNYKVESPPFNVTLPKNNVFGSAPEGLTPTYAIGWYIMLDPLSKGQHVIAFKTLNPDIAFDVEYNLMVK